MPKRIWGLAFLAAFLYSLICFYLRVSPHLSYAFDIDPTDGDFANAVARLAAGQALYLDWYQGLTSLLYAPVYILILLPSRWLGLDTLIFGRWANFLALLAVLSLIFLILQSAARSRNREWALLGLAALGLKLPVYDWLMNVRTDMFANLFLFGALYVAFRFPQKSLWVGVLSVLAIFTKQPYITGAIAFFIFYAWRQRPRLKNFILGGVAAGLLLVIPFELQNEGRFLNTLFFLPNKVFSADWLKWSHYWNLFRSLHGPYFEIFILAWVGAAVCLFKRRELSVLGILFVIDFLMTLKIARNVGGGISYFWPHLFLCFAMAVIALEYLTSLSFKAAPTPQPEMVKAKKGKVKTAQAPAPSHSLPPEWIFAGVLIWCFAFNPTSLADAQKMNQQASFALGKEMEEARKLEEAIRQISARNPGAQWFSTRVAAPVVRAGNILDTEVGTFANVFEGSNRLDPRPYMQNFLSGRYPLVNYWTEYTNCPELQAIIKSCYMPLHEGLYFERHRPIKLQLLKFAPEKAECGALKAQL